MYKKSRPQVCSGLDWTLTAADICLASFHSITFSSLRLSKKEIHAQAKCSIHIPDQAFHSFGAYKSVDRRFFCSSEMSIDREMLGRVGLTVCMHLALSREKKEKRKENDNQPSIVALYRLITITGWRLAFLSTKPVIWKRRALLEAPSIWITSVSAWISPFFLHKFF